MIQIIKYGTKEGAELVQQILGRSQLEYGNVQEVVDGILSDIRKNKDKALFEYTEKFDKVRLTKETIKVTEEGL